MRRPTESVMKPPAVPAKTPRTKNPPTATPHSPPLPPAHRLLQQHHQQHEGPGYHGSHESQAQRLAPQPVEPVGDGGRPGDAVVGAAHPKRDPEEGNVEEERVAHLAQERHPDASD